MQHLLPWPHQKAWQIYTMPCLVDNLLCCKELPSQNQRSCCSLVLNGSLLVCQNDARALSYDVAATGTCLAFLRQPPRTLPTSSSSTTPEAPGSPWAALRLHFLGLKPCLLTWATSAVQPSVWAPYTPYQMPACGPSPILRMHLELVLEIQWHPATWSNAKISNFEQPQNSQSRACCLPC